MRFFVERGGNVEMTAMRVHLIVHSKACIVACYVIDTSLQPVFVRKSADHLVSFSLQTRNSFELFHQLIV